MRSERRQMILWLCALAVGAALGFVDAGWLREAANTVSTVYVRLFRFLAVPVIAVAVTATLTSFGRQKETRRIFSRTITYTLLTTFAASALGLALYLLISPQNVGAGVASAGSLDMPKELGGESYVGHLLDIIPDNAVRPLLDGNVLSVLLISLAVGLTLARMNDSEPKRVLMQGLVGLQEVLSRLIHAIIITLPIGIVAFAAQFTAQLTSGGMVVDSIGRYVAVVLSGNVLQFFIVLPAFLLVRGINPAKAMGSMMPAVLMALFSKSSAATLPVTIECAEKRMGASSRVARFVLPICTTINMNGCAAFILVTSLFVLQNGGVELTPLTLLEWLVVSVVAAIGNAGVPMGCFFLTFSLLSGTGAPVEILGVILPVYTILDMFETAENVWSDSCVCAMTDKDMLRNAPASAGQP